MSRDSASDRPRVTGATFIALGEPRGVVHVQVAGENFLPRAAPLRAKLGDQAVGRVVLRPDGRGFAGTLAQEPHDGDRLFVGYADGELERTDVVFRGGNPTPRAS